MAAAAGYARWRRFPFRGIDRLHALRRPPPLRRRRTAGGAARSRRNTPARGGVAGTGAATGGRRVGKWWLRNRRTCDTLEGKPLANRRDAAVYAISAVALRAAAEGGAVEIRGVRWSR